MPKKVKPATKAKNDMMALGVYKPEFEPIIKIYGQLREQYDELTGQFESSGYSYAEQTATGSKKSPIVTTLESLRKDILSYASQLGLTPQGLLRADDGAFKKKKISALAAALEAAAK